MDWNSLFCEDRIRPSESMAERKSGKDPRTEFDSDFGRVVFSSAARRLHDKTQVIPLTTDDNVHSRLTHSMEVMNVGESIIGFIFSKKTDLDIPDGHLEEYKAKLSSMVKTTCLMHDIGNPPFGHFGEDAISSYFKENRSKVENPTQSDPGIPLVIDPPILFFSSDTQMQAVGIKNRSSLHSA